MKKLLIPCLALVIVVAWLFGLACFEKVLSAEKKPIKVGVIWDYTGTVAEDARRCTLGLKMVVDEFNAAGGLNGRRIELILRDTKQQAGVAAREARDLVYNQKVDFLAGSNNSAAVLAVSEVAKEAKKIYIGVGKSKKITEDRGHRYIFNPDGNTRLTGGDQAYVLAQEPYTKYVTLCGDYAWGRDLAEDFENSILKFKPNAQLLKKLWPKFGEKDFTPFITSILSLNPEVLFCAIWGGDAVTFIRQAKPYGLFEKMRVVCFGSQSVFEALGKDMPEGIYFYLEYHFLYPGKESEKFEKRYYDYSGLHADSMAYNGWVCGTTLVEGIKKAGTTETEAVVKALEGLSFMTPVGKKITIRACDHLAPLYTLVGKTKFVPEYPDWAVLVDFKMHPNPEELLISCDEVRRLREAAK